MAGAWACKRQDAARQVAQCQDRCMHGGAWQGDGAELPRHLSEQCQYGSEDYHFLLRQSLKPRQGQVRASSLTSGGSSRS